MTNDVDIFVELCRAVHQSIKSHGYGETGPGAVNWPLLIAVEGEKIKDLGVTGIDGVRTYFEERAVQVKGKPNDMGYGCDEWAEKRYQHAMESVNNFMGAATCPVERLPTYIGGVWPTEDIALLRLSRGI